MVRPDILFRARRTLLLHVVAEVLEQNDGTRLRVGTSSLHLRADAVLEEGDRLAHDGLEALGHRRLRSKKDIGKVER